MIRRLPLLLAAVVATPAMAGAIESVARVAAAAERALLQAADPDARAEARVDPRLRLPACPVELEARAHDRGTAEVVCPVSAGWRLFVPVRIERQSVVLVARQPIGAGVLLEPALFDEQRRTLNPLAQGMALDRAALGAVRTRRAIAAGAVLTSGDVEAMPVVRRGQAVTLVARSGALEVRAAGKALADAARGQRVAVEAGSSRRVVQGIVLSADRVEVAL